MDTAEHQGPAQPLTRSQHHRIVAGVCGGLAERTDVDPVVYRVTAGLLGCFGVGFLLYGGAWVLLPLEDAESTWLDRLVRRRLDGPAALVVLIGILIAGALFVPPMGLRPAATALVIMAGLAVLTAYRRGADLVGAARSVPARLFSPPTSPSPASPHGREEGPPEQPADYTLPLQKPIQPARPPISDEFDLSGYPVSGPNPDLPSPHSGGARLALWTFTAVTVVTVALVAFGLAGAIPLDARLILAAALVTIGLGGLAGARYGRGRPLIGAGLVVSLLLIASSVIVPPLRDIPFGAGTGDVTWRPTAATPQQPTHSRDNGPARESDQPGSGGYSGSYELALGNATLDLTELPQDGSYRWAASVGAGELRVRVPRGAKVIMHVDVDVGSIVVGGREIASGPDLDVTRTLPAQDPTKVTVHELYLSVSAGEVRVRRVSP